MKIGYNFMVNVKYYDGMFKSTYFIDEKSARDFANDCYTNQGAIKIDLWQRARVGYDLISSVKQNKQVAMSKRFSYLHDEYEKAEKNGIVVWNREFEELKKAIAKFNA